MAASFALDVSKWADKAKARADLVFRKVAIDIVSRVVYKTPVDEGRARGGWELAVGHVPTGSVEINDKIGSATVSRMTAAAMGAKAGDTIFIANNVVYILPLEYGHSKQAPNGMVRTTIEEFSSIVGGAVQQAKSEIR